MENRTTRRGGAGGRAREARRDRVTRDVSEVESERHRARVALGADERATRRRLRAADRGVDAKREHGQRAPGFVRARVAQILAPKIARPERGADEDVRERRRRRRLLRGIAGRRVCAARFFGVACRRGVCFFSLGGVARGGFARRAVARGRREDARVVRANGDVAAAVVRRVDDVRVGQDRVLIVVREVRVEGVEVKQRGEDAQDARVERGAARRAHRMKSFEKLAGAVFFTPYKTDLLGPTCTVRVHVQYT